MTEFKTGCAAHTSSGCHEHVCFLEPGHLGMHACFRGVNWDENGRLKLRSLGSAGELSMDPDCRRPLE
jgi:hypothetical protein